MPRVQEMEGSDLQVNYSTILRFLFFRFYSYTVYGLQSYGFANLYGKSFTILRFYGLTISWFDGSG